MALLGNAFSYCHFRANCYSCTRIDSRNLEAESPRVLRKSVANERRDPTLDTAKKGKT